MRIVLVEPSRDVGDGIARLLQARGHEILYFGDGRGALSKLAADPNIDALIASVEAGSISGVEVCWEARLLTGRLRALYILLMAPSSDEITMAEALDGGADDVVNTPARPIELYAKLRAAERTLSLQRKLMRSATLDPLSGALNRGAFFEEAVEACNEVGTGRPMTMLLLDVDRLKSLNDRYGHDVGDRAIRAVASVARRRGQIVGRLGGDEMAILLKDCELAEALEFAAGLKKDLGELKLETAEGTATVACSFGISVLQPGDTPDEVLKRADIGLYRAKKDGRNRIATALKDSGPVDRSRNLHRFRDRKRQCLEPRERRCGQPASEGLLARVCAVIDLLIASGFGEETAVQILAQKMVSAGIPLPKNTQCEKWDDYLTAWRTAFQEGVASGQASVEYRNVIAAINSVPPNDRLDCVLESDLWNRRRALLRGQPASDFQRGQAGEPI
jgi:diguanylate cyclase (GGDEF)-like protein